jgi:hypothetical protein
MWENPPPPLEGAAFTVTLTVVDVIMVHTESVVFTQML